MSTMVERVARAINEARLKANPLYGSESDIVRAAIAAMREPTDAMWDAINPGPIWHAELRQKWQALIDAALEGK